MADFKDLYWKIKNRAPDAPKYMPATWQSMSGVNQIGEYEELYFFEVSGVYIDDEPVNEGIYYCDKASVKFDRMIEESKLRRRMSRYK